MRDSRTVLQESEGETPLVYLPQDGRGHHQLGTYGKAERDEKYANELSARDTS